MQNSGEKHFEEAFCLKNFLEGTKTCEYCDKINEILGKNTDRKISPIIDEDKLYDLDEKLMFCKYHFQESLETFKKSKESFDKNILILKELNMDYSILKDIANQHTMFQILEEEIMGGSCFMGLEHYSEQCNTFYIFERLLNGLIEKKEIDKIEFLLSSLRLIYNTGKEIVGNVSGYGRELIVGKALMTGFDLILLLQKQDQYKKKKTGRYRTTKKNY